MCETRRICACKEKEIKNSNHVSIFTVSDDPSSEGQGPNRRSPSIGAESSTSINNLDFTHRTRIPSSWITTTTTTTQKPTTSRAPLRTTHGSRTTVKVLDKPSTIRAPPPPSTLNNVRYS